MLRKVYQSALEGCVGLSVKVYCADQVWEGELWTCKCGRWRVTRSDNRSWEFDTDQVLMLSIEDDPEFVEENAPQGYEIEIRLTS